MWKEEAAIAYRVWIFSLSNKSRNEAPGKQ